MKHLRIDTATARRLAVEADCDPRTILRVARGERVVGRPGARARVVLVLAGYELADTDIDLTFRGGAVAVARKPR
jgi:hypothetical protein